MKLKKFEAAKAKAWKYFKREYPFADLSKFEAQTDFNEKHAAADIKFKGWPWFLAKCIRIRQEILVR